MLNCIILSSAVSGAAAWETRQERDFPHINANVKVLNRAEYCALVCGRRSVSKGTRLVLPSRIRRDPICIVVREVCTAVKKAENGLRIQQE